MEDKDIVIEEDIIEIEPEAIIEDVAGVDSNGHVTSHHVAYKSFWSDFRKNS